MSGAQHRHDPLSLCDRAGNVVLFGERDLHLREVTEVVDPVELDAASTDRGQDAVHPHAADCSLVERQRRSQARRIVRRIRTLGLKSMADEERNG